MRWQARSDPAWPAPEWWWWQAVCVPLRLWRRWLAQDAEGTW